MIGRQYWANSQWILGDENGWVQGPAREHRFLPHTPKWFIRQFAMSKRTADEAELETPWIPVRRNPSTRVRASAVLESLVGMFVQEENNALRKLVAELRTDLAATRLELLHASHTIGRSARSLDRLRRANTIANNENATLRDAINWQRRTIDDIFARFPEVGHEYDWLNAQEVFDETETESIGTEDEMERRQM